MFTSIDVKFIFDSARLGLSNFANIFQIAGAPSPCTSLVPRFQKYFSVSCNYLQL